jgi:tol-pal system protein YbgF
MIRAAVRVSGVALLLSGCLATQKDVRQLQQDFQSFRSDQVERDGARRAQFDSVVRLLLATKDTVRELRTQMAAFQGSAMGDLFAIRDGLIEVRSLTGQSQSRITELRAELEQRNTLMQQGGTPPAPAPGGRGGDSTRAPAPPTPGPAQLYTMALDQLRRGSTSTARSGLTDFLAQYPQHENAGEAQYYIAETLEREGKGVDAEAAYLATYTRFPRNAKAPTAMFKRATLLEQQNQAPKAREVLQALVSAYPRSDEADLARDRLQAR